MTIFDTLRYPISDCPTEEELTALPVDLYSNWLHAVDLPQSFIPQITSMVYSGARVSSTIRGDIILLRKMISEYNNDNI